MTDTLTDDQRADLISAINTVIDQQFEYETSHVDAGNNYAHMPRESWSSTDDRALLAQLKDFELDTMGLEADELSDLALEAFKMYAGSVFTPTDTIVLASFPIDEIETQLDFTGLDVPSIGIIERAHIEQVRNDIDAHVGSMSDDSVWLYHGGNYSVWYAVISPQDMQQAIRDRAAND